MRAVDFTLLFLGDVTPMVAMKQVLPKTGPFYISAFRLIPSGLLLIGFCLWKGRLVPNGVMACASICSFALIDAACFQRMVIGSVPLAMVCILNQDSRLRLDELTGSDILATRGSLTKLSSLTFRTPMFASFFGFICLGETFSPLQLVGAVVTVVAIYLVNYKSSSVN